MNIHRETLEIATCGDFDVIDITAEVEKALLASGIQEGFALVFSPHTTVGVYLQEREGGLLADVHAALRRLVPREEYYRHNDWDIRRENMQVDEPPNAHSHIRQIFASKASECIPVSGGRLMLGTWQRIMVIEFDAARPRQVHLQICGA